jgi:hypothetical protein
MSLPCHRLDIARSKIPFELSPEQRAELQRLIQARSMPKNVASRAVSWGRDQDGSWGFDAWKRNGP